MKFSNQSFRVSSDGRTRQLGPHLIRGGISLRARFSRRQRQATMSTVVGCLDASERWMYPRPIAHRHGLEALPHAADQPLPPIASQRPVLGRLVPSAAASHLTRPLTPVAAGRRRRRVGLVAQAEGG